MIAYWGAGSLTRWPKDTLLNVAIPVDAKAFLVDVGLPSPGRDIHGWVFEWDLALTPFNEARKMRLLGRNRGFTPILIDESRNGQIVWDAAIGGYERHINASVQQFGRSLIVLDQFRLEALRTIDADEPYDVVAVRRAAIALRAKLKRIDETAMADENSLWSTIINDLRRETR